MPENNPTSVASVIAKSAFFSYTISQGVQHQLVFRADHDLFSLVPN